MSVHFSLLIMIPKGIGAMHQCVAFIDIHL